MVMDAFAAPRWAPPTITTFHALLRGMVASVDPTAGMPVGSDGPVQLSDLLDEDDIDRADPTLLSGVVETV